MGDNACLFCKAFDQMEKQVYEYTIFSLFCTDPACTVFTYFGKVLRRITEVL